MRKTFKYRLFPTKAQRTNLNQTLEVCRRVYNDTLALRRDTWEQEQRLLSLYDTNKVLTGWKGERPELTKVYSQVLQNVQERVDLTFKAFFRRVKMSEKAGYPRFKSFGRYDSFTFKQFGFRLNEDRLSMARIGDVKIKLHRPIAGVIKTLTVQRDGIGNWYACFSCEVEPELLPVSQRAVGVDLGLANFLVFSDGQTIPSPHFFLRDEKALAKARRKLSQTDKGTPERVKARKVVAHIHHRIANRCFDFAHQVSRRVVNGYSIICFEDLNITGKGQHRSRAKSISEVAWSQLVQFTVGKAAEAGRRVVRVDPHNTTKMCSRCGMLVDKTPSPVHHCPHCALEIERDLNTSFNILRRGLTSVGPGPVEAPGS